MRSFRFVFLLVLITFARSATAQQATASAPQATALLQQCLAALTGGHPVIDVSLSGTAERVAGSDDESGSAMLKALAAGASRVELGLPSGNRLEILNITSSKAVGAWSGPDGVSHPVAYHNLLLPPAWFFPLFPVTSGLSAGYVATYIGHETRNGQGVEHLAISQKASSLVSSGALPFEHLSQIDFFLDSTTLLPAAIAFDTHPDDDALLNIPVEINFSNYTSVNGVQVPFHVQRCINGSLSLDLQLESAVINSGLSSTTFTAGAGL